MKRKNVNLILAVFSVIVLTLGSIGMVYSNEKENIKEKSSSKNHEKEFPYFYEDWSPIQDMIRFQREMSKIFSHYFENFKSGTDVKENLFYVNTDVVDKGDSIVIYCEIPGMEKKNIDISIKNNILTIKGERKEEKVLEDKKAKFIKRERVFGAFERSILLPNNVDINKIKAVYKDGVLKITIPKLEKEKQAEVKVKIE